MNYLIGGVLAGVGGLVAFGAVTGRLAAMLAAVFVPGDLTASASAPSGHLAQNPGSGGFSNIPGGGIPGVPGPGRPFGGGH